MLLFLCIDAAESLEARSKGHRVEDTNGRRPRSVNSNFHLDDFRNQSTTYVLFPARKNFIITSLSSAPTTAIRKGNTAALSYTDWLAYSRVSSFRLIFMPNPVNSLSLWTYWIDDTRPITTLGLWLNPYSAFLHMLSLVPSLFGKARVYVRFSKISSTGTIPHVLRPVGIS